MTCDMPALEKLLSWRLSSFGGHIDFEDLKQECRIAAWRAVTNHTGGCSRNRLMLTAIDAEAIDFLRSPMNRSRTRTRGGAERRRPVSLDDRTLEPGLVGSGEYAEYGWPHREPEPCTPDFVEPLLAQLFARWVWSVRGQVLRPEEIAVLGATVLAERPAQQVAAEQRRSATAVWAEKRLALARYRAYLARVLADD